MEQIGITYFLCVATNDNPTETSTILSTSITSIMRTMNGDEGLSMLGRRGKYCSATQNIDNVILSI